MIRNILVPLDGSTFGEQALPWALDIARRATANVQLLHVHRQLEATYAEMQIFDASLDQHMRDREKTYLDGVAKRLSAKGGVSIAAIGKDGEIAPTIKQHATDGNFDLIVMMTHARGPMRRFWLGSVADELMRDTSTPLLLLHPQDRETAPEEHVAFRHILIPLDGTPLAEQILTPVVPLAQLMNADLTLMRVVKPVMSMNLPTGAGSFGEMAHHMMERVDELQGQVTKEAREYLEKVAKRLRDQGLKVQIHVVVEEQPGVAILNLAKPPVDLIALETHGRRGVARLFLGSVADKVIRGAHVPVLVQRPVHK